MTATTTAAGDLAALRLIRDEDICTRTMIRQQLGDAVLRRLARRGLITRDASAVSETGLRDAVTCTWDGLDYLEALERQG